MHNAASVLIAFALATTALTPPQRAVRTQTRLSARTAEGMAPGWKATTDETGAYELIPASYEYRYQEVYVEIPRTAESPGLGVLLEQFGTLDAENGGLTLVAGLVEGGNAANAGVDLLPGDSIVKAGGTRVECLDYDATVDALMALPPAPAPAGLMVKRLVKVPFVNIKVMFPREEGKEDVTFKMRRGASLRAELLRNRVEMPTCCEDMNCLCNCAVQVRKGAAVLEPPSTQEAQMIKKEPYWRLTCRACVARDAEDGSELVIRVRPDLENVMRRKNPFGIETSFKF
mmetsp:Transcript_22997/g.59836  ORF Transcript_22997/g.59836 Transcript_22997/m.59836 type:complete len:287 (+) Transcript_22997:163-1023(+)